MSGRKKATAKPLLTSSVKLVKPPYLSLVGPQISIHAGWWTAGCGEANESVGDLFLCQVLEVDEQREAQMGVKEVMFKVALVTSKDPHGMRCAWTARSWPSTRPSARPSVPLPLPAVAPPLPPLALLAPSPLLLPLPVPPPLLQARTSK